MTDQKPQGRGPLPRKFPHEPERYRKAAELIVQMRRDEIAIWLRHLGTRLLLMI